MHYTNDGYGYSKGIEFKIQKNSGRISGWIAYSYSNSKRTANDLSQLLPAYFDVPHSLILNFAYKISSSFQATAIYYYKSGRPYTPVISSYYDQSKNIYYPVYEKMLSESERYPFYNRLDLRLTKYFFLKKTTLVAFFEVNNAFNHKNVVEYIYNKDYSTKTSLTISDRFLFVGVLFLF